MHDSEIVATGSVSNAKQVHVHVVSDCDGGSRKEILRGAHQEALKLINLRKTAEYVQARDKEHALIP